VAALGEPEGEAHETDAVFRYCPRRGFRLPER